VAGGELVEVHFAGGATAEQPVDFEEKRKVSSLLCLSRVVFID
jgi:hypothetical protein